MDKKNSNSSRFLNQPELAKIRPMLNSSAASRQSETSECKSVVELLKQVTKAYETNIDTMNSMMSILIAYDEVIQVLRKNLGTTPPAILQAQDLQVLETLASGKLKDFEARTKQNMQKLQGIFARYGSEDQAAALEKTPEELTTTMQKANAFSHRPKTSGGGGARGRKRSTA
eukprot:jgi/Chrzof1/9258/UNPLg00225.t1